MKESMPQVGDPLSPKQAELLVHMANGKSNDEIGEITQNSPLTIKNHVQKILLKLGTPNRTGAVGTAFVKGILRVEDGRIVLGKP